MNRTAGLALLAVLAVLAVLGALTVGVGAQRAPAFAVVSIKPAAGPGVPPVALAYIMSLRESGEFRAPGITAQQLMAAAFPVAGAARRTALIVGGPDWFATAQFQILARTDGPLTDAERATQLPVLLRTVLEERFALRSHLETRSVPVYVLVPARPDGRLGAALHPATTDCPPPPPGVTLPQPPARAGGPAPSPNQCFGGIFRQGTVSSGSITLRSVAEYFTKLALADRIVLDRTGLPGRWNVDLHWSTPSANGAAPIDTAPDAPSLFAAVQEQLGLKLEPRDEPMEVLVVDHIERPSAN